MAIVGFGFPFRQGSSSFPATATEDDLIKASIIQILTTGLGQRIMRPTFGCRIWNYIFENDDETLQVLVEREVRDAIAKWETRVRVDQVITERDDVAAPGQIIVTVIYTRISTGTSNSVSIAGP